MKNLSDVVDRHLAAYTESDKAKRTREVADIWAQSGQLIDPPLVANGREQIVAQADALLTQFPGHVFRRTSDVDEHNGFARYSWNLLSPAGAVALEGCDFAQADEEGRLVQVVGFFGPLPAI